MPYFLKHILAHVTYNVYLVQADTAEQAEQEEGAYLGWFDDSIVPDQSQPGNPIFGPFETETDAKNDDRAWVEGQGRP